MHSLLGFLNNPHSTLKNVVHVVGTKGKGSVAAMLNSVLEDAGYRVGRYTSPHLVCEGERISIGELSELRVVRVVVFCRGNPRNKPATCAGGKPMSLEALDRLIDTNKPLIECALEARPDTSYFEAVTALAIRHFADSEIDWAIMEAGLGGVSDATNVFKAHQVNFKCSLGPTLAVVYALQDGVALCTCTLTQYTVAFLTCTWLPKSAVQYFPLNNSCHLYYSPT